MGVGVDNQELEPQALEPETPKLQSPRALNPATSQHALKKKRHPHKRFFAGASGLENLSSIGFSVNG